MGTIEGTRKVGGLSGQGSPKPAVALYDFAVDGGKVEGIVLRGDKLPKGAVIVDSLIEVQTKLESGGEAKVSIDTEGAGDIQSSKKASEAPWSTAGAKRGSLTATSAPVTTTAERSIVAKVETAALTKGKFRVVVWYVELD